MIVLLLAVIIALAVLLAVKDDDSISDKTTPPSTTALHTTAPHTTAPNTTALHTTAEPTCPSAGIKPLPTGPLGADGPYRHAVVASDAGLCSEIGRDILQKNGTAVDSAVAAMFCIGVYNMHSAGVGGGGFMVVYKKSTKFVEVIDFREEAPGKANRTMYVGGAMSSRYGNL